MLLPGIKTSYTPDNIKLCPKCNGRLSAHAAPAEEGEEPEIPKPGDITICQYCLTPLEFTETMDLVLADMEKILKDDPGFIHELEAARRAAVADRELKQQVKN